jgi:hypothetical protein
MVLVYFSSSILMSLPKSSTVSSDSFTFSPSVSMIILSAVDVDVDVGVGASNGVGVDVGVLSMFVTMLAVADVVTAAIVLGVLILSIFCSTFATLSQH